jgi:hypothetical protein
MTWRGIQEASGPDDTYLLDGPVLLDERLHLGQHVRIPHVLRDHVVQRPATSKGQMMSQQDDKT